MHVVTKILIVFGAILSILLAALTIAFASNADAIRDSVASEQSARLALAADLALQRTRSETGIAELRTRVETAENDKARIAGELASLQNERAQLKAAVKEAELAAETLRNQMAAGQATAATNAKLIEALSSEVRDLRKSQADSAKRESDLVNRLNDLESQRQVLEQSTRALQEQLTEARLALENARSGSDRAAASGTMPVESIGPLVQSRIRNVVTDAAGRRMVEIADGSSAGLKVNQKLNVVRDGKFIGYIVLTLVDAKGSVGRFESLGRDAVPQAGDVILSRIN